MARLGFGPAFLGAYRTVVALADPTDRAGLIAAILTVDYLAFGLPALIAGISTSHFGLHGTTLVYSAAVAGLAAAAALFPGIRSRPCALQAPAAHPDLRGPCIRPPHVPAAHQQAEPTTAPTRPPASTGALEILERLGSLAFGPDAGGGHLLREQILHIVVVAAS